MAAKGNGQDKGAAPHQKGGESPKTSQMDVGSEIDSGRQRNNPNNGDNGKRGKGR